MAGGETGGGDQARTTAAARAQRVERRVRDIGADGRALADDVGALVREIRELVREPAAERPYLTSGACFALGYVLGGGVPPGAIRFLVASGGRMLTGAFLRNVLAAALDPDSR